MKVVLSTIGRFWVFDLARQLQRMGYLEKLFTAYPRWKIDEDLRANSRSFPWVVTPQMAMMRFGLHRWTRYLGSLPHNSLDRWVASQLPECDIFMALSKSGLYTARVARSRGARTVCDRGSSHILYQEGILAEEYARHGQPYTSIAKWAIDKELAEYAEADLITVPSSFVYRTFIDQGVPAEKLALVPFGAELSMFKPVPKEDDVFRVLYVGTINLRKGIQYLLEAFADLDLPDFELVLVGSIMDDAKPLLARYEGKFRYLGFIPRARLNYYYSQASVFAMASIEEGLALVQAQAMACGLPLVTTTNSGGEDLITEGESGFVVPIRDPAALREKVLYLYENPERRDQMAHAALQAAQAWGGWDQYGERVAGRLQALMAQTTPQGL